MEHRLSSGNKGDDEKNQFSKMTLIRNLCCS
jgi:hypothetical protein